MRLANEAIHRGHEAFLLVPRLIEDAPIDTSAEIVVVRPFPIPIVPHLKSTIAVAVSFPYARNMRDFDVVVANYGPTCLASKLVARKGIRKYHLVQHDETVFFSRFSLEYWITRLSYASFEEGRIFVVSKWLQDLVRKRVGLRSVIVPPGIDHETYYPRSRGSHSGKRVLILSRSERWRGLQVFLDAMESVRKEVKDVKIIAASHSGSPLRTSCPVEYISTIR